jgi:hypothetical protein
MRELRIEAQVEKLSKISDMIKWNSKRIQREHDYLNHEIGLFYTKQNVIDRLAFLKEMDLRLRSYMKSQTIKLAELC